MIESQYGDKTFPSFVKWLVGWKVEMKFKIQSFFSIDLQAAHKDLCPDPDEDTPVACHMNPHWSPLQHRLSVIHPDPNRKVVI